MNKKIKTDAVDHLFQAILTLKTPEEFARLRGKSVEEIVG